MKVCLVVEGLNDVNQIEDAFWGTRGEDRIKCLVTEGVKVNSRIIAEIEDCLREGYDVYILSDPDESGKHLANMINEHLPNIPRLEVDLEECGYYTGKKMKAGIEYASYDYLRELIYPLIGISYKRKQYPINWD